MKASVYDTKGKEVKKIDLPEDIFGLSWNADLVHQVVTSMQSNARNAIAHTKERGEVRGGGHKPWKQKGTGRARHGSRRSPIWVGGGVTFGPRKDRNFDKKVNRKMKMKALNIVLSKKLKDGEIIFVENFDFKAPKTVEAKAIIGALAKGSGQEKLATKKKNAAFVAVDERDVNAKKSFANLSNIKLDEIRNLNTVDILNYKYVIIENPEKGIEILTSRSQSK